MRKFLLSIAFGLFGLAQIATAQVVVEPASAVQLCPDGNFVNLGDILIRENNPTDFQAGETDVTYSLIPPAGFQFQAFTGAVDFFPVDSFTNTSIVVNPDSVEITYSIGAGTNTTTDTIIIRGLRIQTSTASLAAADITRSGSATHTGNADTDLQNHATLSSGAALSGITLTPTDISCNGLTDGEIAVVVASGNAPYDYSTNFGASYPFTSTPITGLSAGGYFVTVRDALGCVTISDNAAVINEPSSIQEQSVASIDITCNGNTDGKIIAIASGGTGTITYSTVGNVGGTFITNSGDTAMNLTAGLKDVYFQDANGCLLDGTDITINEPSIITETSVSGTDITCNGAGDGTIMALATGGTGAISYSINGSGGSFIYASGSTVGSLPAGLNDVFFQDANGCQVDGTDITINEPSAITEISTSKVDISCFGLTDGKLFADASGGTGTIRYSINGLAGPFSTLAGDSSFNLSSGIYDIRFQDDNGCTLDGTDRTVAEPSVISEVSISSTNVLCFGDNNGTITADASGGTGPIIYSVNGFSGSFSTPAGGTTSSLAPGAYSIYYQDNNGCKVPGSSISITQPTQLVEISTSSTDISCFNDNDGTVTALASGGTSPIFFSIGGSTGSFTNTNGSTVGSLPGPSYDIFFRDANNCLLDGTDRTVTNPSQINIPAPLTSDPPTTAGGTDGTIEFDVVTGGNSPYQYSINGGSTYQTSALFDFLPAGTYTLQVIDANNCVEILSPDITLQDPGNITGGAISFQGRIDSTVCNGALNIMQIQSDTAEPQVGAVAYQWQQSTDGVVWNNIAGEISATYDHLPPHTSRLFFRRRTTQNTDVAFSNTVELKINNGDLVTLTIPDKAVCVETSDQTFTASPVPIGAATGVFTALTGLTDNGNGTAAFDPFLADTGTFTIEYTYVNRFGCQSVNSDTIRVNRNDSASLTGPTNYLTSDPATPLTGLPSGGIYGGPGVFGNQFFPGLGGVGNYPLTYTYEDINQCIDIATLIVDVTVAGSGSINLTSTEFCSNAANETITGSPASGEKSIGFIPIPGLLTPLPDSVSAIISPNFPPGDYTLQYVFELGLSTDTITASIRINTAPTAAIFTPNNDSVFCENDDPITLTGAPANGITDFNGQGIVAESIGSAIFRPDSAGIGIDVITYTIQDAEGCIDTDTINLYVDSVTNISMNFSQSGDYCSNDAVDLITGSPLPDNTNTFAFFSGPQLSNDNGNGTVNFTPSTLSVGLNTFTYTFTNAEGCVSTIDSIRRVVLQPTASISGLDVDYCVNNGTDTLFGLPVSNAAGTGVFVGLGPASGSIDPVTGVLNIDLLDSLQSYDFAYVYTDTTGCTDQASAQTFINALPVISFPASFDTAYCVDDPPIQFEVDPVSDGSDIFKYSGPGVTTIGTEGIFTAANAILGTNEIKYVYTEIHSGNNCTDSASQLVTVNPLPFVDYLIIDTLLGDTIDDLAVCKNQRSIFLESNQSSGTWFVTNSTNLSTLSNGNAIFNPFLTPLSQTQIRFRHTDINGCINDTLKTIDINPLPINFDYVSLPANKFDPDTTEINEFCTEDDSVLLVRFGGFNGTGFFRMSPPGNPNGGVFPTSSPDTAVFKSALQSGITYNVRYIFTDTTTGCTDSVSRKVSIQSEPFLSVDLLGSGINQTINNNQNDTISICTNGDSLLFAGFNFDSATSTNDPVPFSQSVFSDETDTASTFATVDQLGNPIYAFFPDQTSVLGLHTMQFDFTSNTGCKDKFTFTINVLDTPSLDVVIDTSFLSTSIPIPELCQSVDTLVFSPVNNLVGTGDLWISKQNPISPDILTDTLRDGSNDTLLLAYPSSMVNLTGSRLYFVNYRYIETVSGNSCENQISRPFIVHALPDEQFTSQDLDQEYCEYDQLDTFSNAGPVMNLDTSYFKGIGFTNIDSFRSVLDPGVLTPDTTDAGSTTSFWYIFTDDNQCTDSIPGSYTIHPRPDIVFATSTDTIRDRFCLSNTASVTIEESQLVGNLSGTTVRKFSNSTQNLGGPSFRPSLFAASGPDTLSVSFTSAAGCIDIDSQVVYFYDDPVANFFAENFCISDPIQFSDSSTININPLNPADSIVSWEWQLSPTDLSTDRNPTFNYNQTGYGAGTYNIELTVENTIGCEDDTDKFIFFGAPPLAKFNFDDFCAGRDIEFVNTSADADSVSPGDFIWTFSNFPFDSVNAIDNIVNNGSFIYQFANPGAYAVKLDLSTSYGCTDDTLVRVDIKPIIDLSNGAVYTSNFDLDTVEWRPRSAGGFSWEQAIPNTNRLNSGPDSANQTVWVTNANGNHFNNEQSYVEGPCFDFSQTQRPMIRFDYFTDVNDVDGVVLQFSPDKGRNWYNVGDEETGINWFNETSLAGNPGGQTLRQVGWNYKASTDQNEINQGADPPNTWREGRHSLDQLRNRPNPNLRLRFALGSSAVGGTGTRNGFAFTNVQISERDKLVLIEHFTNSSDPNSRQGDLDHNALIASNNNEFDVRDIQYHTDFPNADPINLDNSLEQGARSLFYGVSTVPRTVFEGNVFNNATSSWVAQSNILENGKHRLISERILEDAKFSINLDVTKTSNDLNGTATFTANEDLPAGREYTAFIAVIERFIPTSATSGGVVLQGVEFRSAFKKFLPRASGTNFSTIVNQGDAETVNFSWTYANVYNPDSVYVIAFIQDNITREVFQVATDDTTNIWVPNSIDRSIVSASPVEFRLYPNPTRGRAIISLNAPAENQELLTIYDQMGNLVVQEELLPGTQNALINLEGYAAGVYIIQLAHPEHGVSKSKLILSK